MIFRVFEFLFGFLAIGFIVFLHELGHYFFARLFNVEVEVLSYGMGPRLFSIYGRNTEFRISLFPFGGYCRMKGSIDLEKALRDNKDRMHLKENGSYFAASPIVRIMIYLAGPLTNYIIAFLLLLTASIIPVERISNKASITPISEYPDLFTLCVNQDGIQKGDIVLSLNGYDIQDWQMLRDMLSNMDDKCILTILRNGDKIYVEIAPTYIDGNPSYGLTLYQEAIIGESSDPALKRGDKIVKVNGEDVYSTLDVYEKGNALAEYSLVIERGDESFSYFIDSNIFPFSWDAEIVKRSDVPFSRSFSYAFKETNDFFFTTLRALASLVTFHINDAREVITGPVNAAETIASISTEAFKVSKTSGFRTLLYLLAIVSISLSIGNILPIPTFDGGQILICIAEIIRKGNLKTRTYLRLQIIGMILAIFIMIGMYYFDIKDYFF